MRRCLLKGREQRFHPRQARQRYCSEGCREAARKWSRWKAQERYRFWGTPLQTIDNTQLEQCWKSANFRRQRKASSSPRMGPPQRARRF
jgi:hypothetical protein